MCIFSSPLWRYFLPHSAHMKFLSSLWLNLCSFKSGGCWNILSHILQMCLFWMCFLTAVEFVFLGNFFPHKWGHRVFGPSSLWVFSWNFKLSASGQTFRHRPILHLNVLPCSWELFSCSKWPNSWLIMCCFKSDLWWNVWLHCVQACLFWRCSLMWCFKSEGCWNVLLHCLQVCILWRCSLRWVFLFPWLWNNFPHK